MRSCSNVNEKEMYSYTRFCAAKSTIDPKKCLVVWNRSQTFSYNCQKQAFNMVDQNRAMHRPLYYIDFGINQGQP